MKVTQVAEYLNAALPQNIGQAVVSNEDITNIVDIGRAIENLSNNDFENFMGKLPDVIGRTLFVDRPYAGTAPSVMMSGWEYGSILQKIRAELPEATDNETWALQDGQDYPVTEFTASTVSAKYFNSKTTYSIPISLARRQVLSAFHDAQGVNALFSLIQGWIEKRKTVNQDMLIRNTIASFMAGIINDANSVRAINLLSQYNTATEGSLTVDNCLFDLGFLKYAAYIISVVSDRMTSMSRLYNVGGTTKFTPKSAQHLLLLSDFAKRADVYLQSDTFHNEYTRLPNAETVNFWQGEGTDYSFSAISSIDVKAKNPKGGADITVKQGGILGVLFDRNALGVTNFRDYTTSFYNPRAEFTNMWYKTDCGYFNDFDENGVVFYVAAD